MTDDCMESGVTSEEFRFGSGARQVERCNRCKRLRAISLSPEIAQAAIVGARLHRLSEGGATFSYPDSLSPYEWTAIDALQRAHGLGEEQKAKEQYEQAELARRQATVRQFR